MPVIVAFLKTKVTSLGQKQVIYTFYFSSK